MSRTPIHLTERGEWVMGTLAGLVAIVGIPAAFLLILTVFQ